MSTIFNVIILIDSQTIQWELKDGRYGKTSNSTLPWFLVIILLAVVSDIICITLIKTINIKEWYGVLIRAVSIPYIILGEQWKGAYRRRRYVDTVSNFLLRGGLKTVLCIYIYV